MNVCIIQARMGSTRFPGKVLAELSGTPVLSHVIKRCKLIAGIDKVVVAVPDEPRSIAIQDLCDTHDIEIFAGPEHDVLLRYYKTAIALGRPANIMRITADCPLISPLVCSEVLTLHIAKNADYTSNIFPTRTYPKGMDCEVMTFDALEASNLKAMAPYDREHVTPWLQRTKGIHRACVAQKRDDSTANYCIDWPEDIERVGLILDKAVRDTQPAQWHGERSGQPN